MALCRPSLCPGTKEGGLPTLCLLPSNGARCCYRRSTTVKAPRKRTFLDTVTKRSARSLRPIGAAPALANNVGMLCCWKDTDNGYPPYDFFAGNNIGNNNGNNNNNNGNFGASGDDGDFGSSGSSILRAFLGGLALTFALAVFPSKSYAMPGSSSGSLPTAVLGARGAMGTTVGSAPTYLSDSLLSSSAPSPSGLASLFERTSLGGSSHRSSAASTPSRPRSKVMHVACKGSTLVVPLPAGGETHEVSAGLPRAGPFQRKKIVDAPIALSVREAELVAGPQYRIRESVRI